MPEEETLQCGTFDWEGERKWIEFEEANERVWGNEGEDRALICFFDKWKQKIERGRQSSILQKTHEEEENKHMHLRKRHGHIT